MHNDVREPPTTHHEGHDFPIKRKRGWNIEIYVIKQFFNHLKNLSYYYYYTS